MRVLVIPDIHLKPWMFDKAVEVMNSGVADKAICLMDIPDDWNQEFNIDLYIQTFDRAIQFQDSFPDTLWCYGNHDLSYIWGLPESGFSSFVLSTVGRKLAELRYALSDDSQLAYIHRIDNVLFMHGGLTRAFVKRFAPDTNYDDIDAVLSKINTLGCDEMWQDGSPIWYRPQLYSGELYKSEELLQVVGHTPVAAIRFDGNVLSCDVFSTDLFRNPIGTQEFAIIDTQTWECQGIK